MTFERYLAEEIALDHLDGIITRREALRRLALLGVGAAAATSLLAACAGGGPSGTPGSGKPGTGPPSEAGTAPPPGQATALPMEPIAFPGPGGRRLQGAWASHRDPRGAVLVVHENRGLTDHIRSVAGRLAGHGYAALAVDLLSEEGGTASFADPAEATAALSRVRRERFVADMQAGIDELGRRAPGAKPGAIGFCFGGAMVWTLLTSEPRLRAAVPFYGPLPDPADFSGAQAAVLAVYAGLDERVNATRERATRAMERAGLTHRVVTFPGVDHAFFNDTGPRYDAAAAEQAYRQVLDWFAGISRDGATTSRGTARQRFTVLMSAYRAPAVKPLGATSSMRARSASVSVTLTAPTFSSR